MLPSSLRYKSELSVEYEVLREQAEELGDILREFDEMMERFVIGLDRDLERVLGEIGSVVTGREFNKEDRAKGDGVVGGRGCDTAFFLAFSDPTCPKVLPTVVGCGASIFVALQMDCLVSHQYDDDQSNFNETYCLPSR